MLESSRRARPLLLAGAVAAPLLLLVIGVDGSTRSGYDTWHHGVSQLTLGELGWLERLTYVLCGLVLAAFAVGVKRRLVSGAGATWGPRLIAAVGLGLVVAGVFPTDPAFGYPVAAVETVSANGRLHQLGGSLLFAGLIGACFALARRFGRDERRGWTVYSTVTGCLVAASALAAGIVYRLETVGVLTAGPAGGLERIAFLLGFGWITLLAVHLMREPVTSTKGVSDGTPRGTA
ncbi:DUF998 domain-containing protein [Flindersiella endophytica]